MSELIQVGGAQHAAQLRAMLKVNGGRVTTSLLPMPDGTGHLEPGMSVKLELAARFMAASIACQPDRKVTMSQHVAIGIEGAKALLAAFKADGEAEAAQKANVQKALSETRGDDAP